KKYAAEFLDLKTKHEQLIANRKQLELELATTQEHHDKYKQDLMRVRNEKEYTTALREIDATKKHASALETEILKNMEELEKLEAELKEKTPDIERQRAEVDQNLAALDKEMEDANRQLTKLGEQRAQLSGRLSKQNLSTYERMSRTRRGQALSELRSGICTACRMKVRPKVSSDVRKGDQLITCESCGRILYYRAETAQPAEAGLGHKGSVEK